MNSDTCVLSVGDLIDVRPLSRFQVRVVALCGLIMLLDGFEISIGFLVPAISGDLGIPLPEFGPVFAASLFGLMIAAMVSGPIADRWGRKWVIVISTLTFASFSIMTARATLLEELVLWRFLTGLGLGGAMSNVIALASEYAPKRMQLALVAALLCGMPLGGLLGSLAGLVMIPFWGWRSVPYLGGFLPLFVAMISIKLLPESLRFLALQRAEAREITGIVERIAPELRGASVSLTASRDDQPKKLPLKHLFTQGRAIGTVLLWILYFMNLLIIYFILNWLPGLLWHAGMPASAGVTAISFFAVGGIIGSLAQGRLMAGGRAGRVLPVEFAASTVLIALLAFAVDSFVTTLTLTLILSICVTGAHAGLSGLAAGFYPTSIRATGLGWASGIGRMGSIIGPTLGGILLSMQWTPRQIFLAATLPALFAASVAVKLSQAEKSGGYYSVFLALLIGVWMRKPQ
jgi:AAHS family 4-hydroxybenzoate transporter-like MFS transporter